MEAGQGGGAGKGEGTKEVSGKTQEACHSRAASPRTASCRSDAFPWSLSGDRRRRNSAAAPHWGWNAYLYKIPSHKLFPTPTATTAATTPFEARASARGRICHSTRPRQRHFAVSSLILAT